jgi:asparagine synthase (glutamine-hydrolysing)
MCGIAGRFQPAGLPENTEWAKTASYLLRHRGPDGEGFFRDDCCELVHRRLAIIDLTDTGIQPMTNEDRSLWITYNGEIYGYESMRQEMIQKGHTLSGTSDTEVLLHLYEEYGIAMLSRLRGIYAFALYDQKKQALYLVRDRFGTKPLYYTRFNGQTIFGSEMKAILAWEDLRPQIDHQACYDFLSWGYIPEPATGFKDIYALPRGSYLEINPEGQTIHRYSAILPGPEFSGDLDQAVEQAAHLLQDAIRLQQVADVPVGSLLSGGIDSGLVTTAYSKVTDHDFYTFTVGFPDAAYDETELARQTAEHLGTRHTVISCKDWQLSAEEATSLLLHFDQPFSDTSLFAVNMVAKGIHDSGLRCALSGDGGDESFGGYATYMHLPGLLAMRRIPGFARSLAASGSRLALGSRSPGRVRQLRRAIDIAGSQTPSQFLTEIVSYITDRQKQELVPAAARDGLLPIDRFYEPFERGWDLETMDTHLTNGMFEQLLPSDMLKKTDMMSMRNSVEIRVPMLDEMLVNFAIRLPHDLKANRSKNKLVLRELANRWLPPQVSQAKKRGFGVPLDTLASDGLKQMMKEPLLAPQARIRAFTEPAFIQHWITLFENKGQDQYAQEVSREGLYQRLFFLLSLELWMQKYKLSW